MLDPRVLIDDHAFLQNQIAAMLAKTHVSTLVRVISVTNAGDLSPVGYVDILPLVQQLDTSGKPISHAVIHNVPYSRVQGGANAVIIDPQAGDIGAAIFCDKDISRVKVNAKADLSKAESMPGSLRRHDMSDAAYLYTVIGQTPTQYIQFNSAGITVHSPVKVTVSAPDVQVNAQTAEVIATASAGVTAPVINLGASGQTLREFITSAFQALFNSHTHPIPGGNSSPPNQQLGSSHMTTTVKGG